MKPLAARLAWVVTDPARRAWWPMRRRVFAVRRVWFVVRVRLLATMVGARLDLRVAHDAEIGRIHVELASGTTTRVTVGHGARLHDGVVLWLRGGSIDVHGGAEVRRGAKAVVSGDLVIGADAMVGWDCVLHCAASLVLGDRVVLAERVTVTDSRHPRTPLAVNLLHHVRVEPTVVGEGVWIGANAVVASGVVVGDGAVVGGGAVVTTDVDPWWLVAGNPARPVRRLAVEETVAP